MRSFKTRLLFITVFSSLCAGCYGEMIVGDEEVTCTNDRLVKLVIENKEFPAMRGATPDAQGGYFLFGSPQLGDSRLTRVDPSGNTEKTLLVPSDLGPSLSDLVLTQDGGALISGAVDAFSGNASWVGKVDAAWELAWEITLDMPASNLVLLPDGGAVVGGETTQSEASGFSWARIDPNGGVVWERTVSLPGVHQRGWWGRMLVLHPQGIRALVATDDGIQLIASTADGEWTQKRLETRLALGVADVAALPDGSLAIASARSSSAVLTMIGPDGSVRWEKVFGQGEFAQGEAVAYNAGRNELLLGGSYRGSNGGTQRTWIIATDLDGHQTWELVREPVDWDIDGNVASARDDQGPGITDIAVQPDGSFVATGQTSNLSYFVVSADDCSSGGG